MPETSKLEKLNWELEKSEKKLRKAINDEKALQYQLKQLKVDAVRGIELVDGNSVDVPPGGHVVRQNGLHPLIERLTAGPATKNVIKDLCRSVVLIFGGNDFIAALPQII